MQAIQFETAVKGNTILIPEQYRNMVPSKVHVTLIPANLGRSKNRTKTKVIPSNIDEIPAVLDTKGWKFNREEANER